MSKVDRPLAIAIPNHIRFRRGAGNWKDFQCLQIVLRDLGVPFEVVEFDPQRKSSLYAASWQDFRAVIVQYSLWPDVLELLRERAPQTRIFVRTSNAEALQYIHRQPRQWKSVPRLPQRVIEMMTLARKDMDCRRIADGLLGISLWDNENYWRWLPGKAQLYYLPYFSCWPEIKPEVMPLPWNLRERQVLAMPARRDRIGNDIVEGLLKFARHSRCDGADEWSFVVTEGVVPNSDYDLTLPAILQRVPTTDPWQLLSCSRAVAVLSSLGFGLKTTVVDALAAGCHVLVHKKLAARLPDVIRHCCLEVDPNKIASVEKAFADIEQPPAPNIVNAILRREARETAEQAFREQAV